MPNNIIIFKWQFIHSFLYAQVAAYAAELAFRAVRADRPAHALEVISWFSDFFKDDRINSWILQHGGWVSVVCTYYYRV